MSNERDITSLDQLQQDAITVDNNSGFEDPRKYGMIIFGDKQLKQISKLLAEKAQHMTPEQIAQEVAKA